MILVKGDRVILEQADGTKLPLPKNYGIIHDTDGAFLHKCEIFLGPYTVLRAKPPAKDRAAMRYFGETYDHKPARVNVPSGPWETIAKVVKIYYVRPGKHAGGFYHPFKSKPLDLSKCGKFYMLSLPDGCIVDERGFVWP